jgi:glycosyltransferase involved in cell wall biosynthesis
MSRTPVLIAARNEGAYIERTLRSLDASTVEPFVLANDCQDNTSAIAESFGAHVTVCSEEGKLPALQTGLRLLGSRALGNVLYLDADATPLLREPWVRSMTDPTARTPGIPMMVNGMIMYRDRSLASCVLYSIQRKIPETRAHYSSEPVFVNGANILTRLFDSKTLEAILALPHYWPGEDRAMARTILNRGGVYLHSMDPRTHVAVSARFKRPWLSQFADGWEMYSSSVREDYLKRAPKGSMPYEE